jgi:hypothetical protein
MAKQANRKRGRPRQDVSLDERVMCRLDKPTRSALEKYVERHGAGAAATAVRMILVEKLRGEGLL